MTNLKTLLVIVFTLSLYAHGAAEHASPTLKVAVIEAGKPWSSTNKEGKPEGISFSLVDIVFKAMNITTEYTPLLYNRALHGIEKGDIDVMAITQAKNITLTLPDHIIVTPTPVGSVPLYFYKKHSRDIKITSAEDLKNYRIGVVPASKKPPTIDNIIYYTRNEPLFKALVDEDIDIAIGIIYFDHNWGEKFKVKAEELFVADILDIYMAFSTLNLGDRAWDICREFYINNQNLINNGSIEKKLTELNATKLIPFLKIQNNNNNECINGHELMK